MLSIHFQKNPARAPQLIVVVTYILTVRMSVAFEDMNFKRKVSLTQLRKNTCPRTAKISGKKHLGLEIMISTVLRKVAMQDVNERKGTYIIHIQCIHIFFKVL